jgi:hypothetical protein
LEFRYSFNDMLHATTHQSTKKRRRPIITDEVAAQRLGVTRTHLNLVINGYRKSRRLTAAYKQLIEQTGGAAQ